MGVPTSAELEQLVATRLRGARQRLTRNRVDLVGILAAADRPLTIPEVLARGDRLAQSSVYRNLVVLEQAGLVRRVVTHDEFARFELAEDLTGHHHHLVCRECGRVEDVPATTRWERAVADAAATVARERGFRIDQHRLDLVGSCADCTA